MMRLVSSRRTRSGFVFLGVLVSLSVLRNPPIAGAEEPPGPGAGPVEVSPSVGTWQGPLPADESPVPRDPTLLKDNGLFVTGTDDGCGTQSPRNTSQIEAGHTGYGFSGGATPGAATELNHIADDFIVPAGQVWYPTQLKWYAYQTQNPGGNPPTNTLTGIKIQIWSGTPGSGGTVIGGTTDSAVPLASNVFSGVYRVSSAGLTNCQRAIIELTADLTQLVPALPSGGLGAGTYWIDVNLTGNLVNSATWCPPTVPSHQNGPNSDNALQSPDNGVNWFPVVDGLDQQQVDFPFKLYGYHRESPSVFTYQGRLKNGGGDVNGTADLQFTFFYTDTGGTALSAPWVVLNHPVVGGIFTTEVEMPPLVDPGLTWWLEIAVRHPAGSGAYHTLTPRQRVTTTPRARFADTCDQISAIAQVPWNQISGVPAGFADGNDYGGPWNMHPGGSLFYNGNIGIGNIVPTARLHIDGVAGTDGIRFPDGTLQTTAFSAFAGTGVATTASRSDHFHSLLAASDGSPANAVTVDDAGSVGIGTSTPGDLLHVFGGSSTATSDPNARVIIEDDVNNYLQLLSPTASQTGILFGSGALPIRAGIIASSADALQLRAGGNSTRVTIDSTGNVGIGTVTPGQKLDVAGTAKVTGFQLGTSATAGHVLTANGSGVGTWQAPPAGLAGTGTATRIPKFTAAMSLGDSEITESAAGDIGIGTDSPLAKLHVRTDPYALQASALETDDIVILSGDACLGLYSTPGGLAGSAISFKEIDSSGLIVNTWGIYRRTTTGGNALRFSFGISDNYASNATMVEFTSTGDLDATGNLSANTIDAGLKSFKIDHPLDPENKYLYHSCVESHDMMNVYNGNIVTDASGYATVTLPDWFEALNRDFRYQLTVVDDGDTADFVQVKVVRKIKGNQFTLRASRGNVEVSWQVTGIRQDAFAKANPIVPEVDKEPANKGLYLHPEAFGLPRERGIRATRDLTPTVGDATDESAVGHTVSEQGGAK